MSAGRLMEHVRERKARHRQHGRLYRVSFVVLAVLIVLLGVVLVPLPGPGWLVVALGFAMLALEFDRAERVLERIVTRIERVSAGAAAAGPVQKVLGGAMLALGAGAAVGAVILWDIPFLPG